MRVALFLAPDMFRVVPTVYPESPRSWLEVIRLRIRVRVRVRVRLRNLTVTNPNPSPNPNPKPKHFKP